MKFKYAVSSNSNLRPGSGCRGRPVKPEEWCTGPDPVRHEKYYAWKKHQSQAAYRGEEYYLTWEDWEALWPDEVWAQRGKSADSVCLARIDFTDAWRLDNVEIIPRIQQLRRQKEYKNCAKQ
jgi:hypothetical protein